MTLHCYTVLYTNVVLNYIVLYTNILLYYTVLYTTVLLYCTTFIYPVNIFRTSKKQYLPNQMPRLLKDRLLESFTATLSQKMAPQSSSDTILTAARLDNNLLDDQAKRSDTEFLIELKKCPFRVCLKNYCFLTN